MSVRIRDVLFIKKVLRFLLPERVIAILNATWANYSFRSFKSKIVRHRYGAHDLQLQLVDFDGQAWFDRDLIESESAEFALLKSHKLVPGAKVFDAGANQCVQAMMMAKDVAPAGFVWAIEPNNHNARAGRRNCELNAITNLEVIEAAVSSQPGQLWFNRAMNSKVVNQNDPGAHLVDVVTVDGLSARLGPPDVLYVDVEGFECDVLEGARETLSSNVPDCFVEVHLGIGLERYGGSVQKLISFFPSNAYDLYYKTGGGKTFLRASDDTKWPSERFFIVALAKR